MRSKEKVPTRYEILKNFTREFLIEEKRRCEIDRYVTDFRILIHKSPHENHNYLNRLLQDYTTMFLSHERVSANKMNQEGMKYQLKSQLASRKKNSPKQRYVKSKLSEKDDTNSEHQSYLVLKSKTEDFLKKIRQYEELEQIAYEIFVQNSEIKTYQYEIREVVEPNNILKLKSTENAREKPYKKHQKNVYVVNSPGATGKHSATDVTSKKMQESEKENYEYLMRETVKFLANNRDYNDAEQKMLSEQYNKNAFIKKYVDNLNSSGKSKKATQTPKRGIYSKIKSMIGFSPETPTKFYKNVEDNSELLVDSTKTFLRKEKKYNNFEFEAYKLFYIKNGDFQNPLIEKIKLSAYDSPAYSTENGNKSKIEHLVGLKNANSNQRFSVNEEFEDFNRVECSPTEKDGPYRNIKAIHIESTENIPKTVSKSSNEENRLLRENTNHFLNKIKVYEDQQRYFFVIHKRKYHINPLKEKKETLLIKIKHLFFGKHEKSKEKLNYFKEITQEFLKNEQYYYGLQEQALRIFSEDEIHLRNSNRNRENMLRNERSISLDAARSRSKSNLQNNPERQSLEELKKDGSAIVKKSSTLKKRQKHLPTSSLHQRSKSEDLLMFKTRSKSLESKKSPTGHKTFSDRLKSMVGIGNKRKTKSRENISRLTDPVHYFLEHERFYYNGSPIAEAKYGRSVSALENTTKDGTLKTRTKKFLSTENVLYQDSNTSLTGKPPSGRRRKQERNRDEHNKRRSRTLSPAQKLVSKIRTLVQKSSPDKTKGDPDPASEKTDIVAADPKSDNHGMKKHSAEAQKYVNEISSYHVEMNSQQSPISALPIEIDEVNINQIDQNKPTTSVLNEKDTGVKIEEFKKSRRILNISDDPELIKNHTKIFLDDIKRYHEIDKEPDTMDKTLIFINNKSDGYNTIDNKISFSLGNSSEALKTHQLRSMNRDDKNNKAVHEHTETISENFRESSTNQAITTTENSSRKIIQNRIVKETKIIQNVKTQKVQQKSISRIVTQELKTTSNIEDISPAKEHIYENIFVSGADKINPESRLLKSSAEYKKYSTTEREIMIPETSKNTTSETVASQYHMQNKPLSLDLDINQVEVKQFSASTEKGTSTMKEARPKSKLRQYKYPEMNDTISGIQSSVTKIEHSVDTSELQTAAPRRIEKSPEEQEKTKENTFAKIKSFVSGSPKKQSADESNRLLRKQTNDFLDDMRKQHDEYKDASDKCKVVWLSEQTLKPTKTQTSKSEIVKPIVLSEQERKEMRFIRQNTDIFLKDHQDYHNKQRNEDNHFIEKIGKPEHMIWLSSKPAKKKENIITKVKNLMSPQQPKKSVPSSEASNNKLVREQTDEFLKKHQYLIHKDEVDFTRTIVPIPVEKENISVDTTELQTAAPKRIEKSPEKEEKTKKNTFSKIKSFVSGSPKKQSADESNRLLRNQTNDFLDDMRKQHDEYKDASDKCKVVWLSEQTLKPTKTQTSKSEIVRPIVLSEQERKEMRLIRQNTDIFMKDHQDYHNKQRNEDNHFIEKIGKPEHMIWLSSKPAKKKENIITKVKNLMSPQQPKKSVPSSEASNNKLVREQTDEFLKKHQYLIHKDEVDFTRTIVPIPVEKENISVDTTELQTAAPKRIEKSPEKEEKTKKNTFSKIKSFVSGSPKKQSADESNRLLRKQTNDFLDDMRKQHDEYKDASDKCKVVWLSEQTLKPTKTQTSKSEIVKPIVLSEQERKEMRLIRQNTDIFLKDHQDYHNKQRNEDNHFIEKIGKPEHMIWLSSKPAKKKENIITKVKNLMSPQQPKKSVPSSEASNNKLVREQTDEFLKKHQYLIHKDEVEFIRTIVPIPVEKENISVDTTELQTAAPKKIEKSPEKEEKTKKNTFSKIKSFVSGSPKKQSADESNRLLRKQTNDFLDDMRKQHDEYKDASDKCKVVWLSEQTLKPTKTQTSKSEIVKPIVLSEQERKEMRLIRQNTDIFLKDHQDYHNKQRNEDNHFIEKIGKPEHMIWLSSKPAKKKENIITKVKNLMSPQQPKKSVPSSEASNNKLVREQTDEFLKKHQYLIHKDEVDFTRTIVPIPVEKENISVDTTELQTAAPKRIEKSPEKEEKTKKNTFSKIKSFVSGSPKKQSADESNRLLRKQTNDFLDDIRKQHDEYKDASDKCKVVWLSEQTLKPTKTQTSKSEIVKPIVLSEQERKEMRLIRQNTDIFLKDHQDYHNKQRNEDNHFIEKIGKPEHMIWLSSKPAKKKENIITKVKNLMSPQQPKKSVPSSDASNNKLVREQTDEFLKKHQYLIHKDEVDFTRTIVPIPVEKENITVDTTELQTAAPKRIEKTPEKEEKTKKNTFSKIKSFVSGSPKKQSADESNRLLRKQTNDFLDDMRKQHDEYKDASDKCKVVWLSEQTLKPTKTQTSKSEIVKPIVLSEQERKEMRLIRQNTDIFLKEHQDYHNKQRNEDNHFIEKIGKPEHMIWLSSKPAKKKENIITKVKNLMSPQQPKKSVPSSEASNNKLVREQTDEFLKKHQYLIHKDEVDFTRTIVPIPVEKENISVDTTELQTAAPKRIEKSPEKEEKTKKNTFSKIKSFVSGSPKKQSAYESNRLLRKQTNDFLDDMRKQHDEYKDASDECKVVWLSEQTLKPTKTQTSKSEIVKPIVLSEQERKEMRLIRQNTDIFLKDHQDYHNKQRNEDNHFIEKIGKPEHMIWLSSKPAKKKENIITKVKNLMSPQQPKKSVPSSEASNNKLVREQTDEFLKKHQYLIHKDEVDFTRTIVPIPVEKENITVDTTELQTAAPKRIEKTPEKEEKTKKNTFSKIKSFVSGSPKKQSADESNRLLRKQTNDFLDDMRKQHDEYKDASDKCKVVWLSEQTLKPTKTQTSKSEIVKPIVLSEQERKEMRLIRQNTDIFLKDHQDYHNKQRNEDNHFIEKIGKPEHMIWLSSKPAKKKENIITKVKNLMSPQQPKKSVPSSEASNNKLVREQTDEFLKKHQYLIHKDEVDFTRTIVPIPVEKENISVDTTELQTAAPKRIEKSPEKEEKTKKNTFSKIKSFVSGSPKKQSADESNRLLRKQTNDFLDDMRKQHDEYKDASDKCKVVWLSEQTLKPTKTPTSKSEIVKPIVLSEQERKEMRLIRQNTDIFLKDHQDYHNKQRNEDNHFIEKIGKPEHMIWLSSKPAKKKENIITKVKNLMSPQQPKKSVPSSEASNNKLVREQTDEFLKKHQYLIHKDEVDFTRTIVPIPVEKENISVDTTELQTAAPKRIEKSPEKEEKTKKNTFSKIKSFVSGSPKKQSADESNRLLRNQTNDFLDDMRKQHDEYKDASDKCKVVWLSEQTLKPTKTQTSKSEIVKPIVLSEQERKEMRLIRQNTDIFLKDHQDYHNKQRNEDNHFIEKIGKPEHMIWLSSKPAKKKENIITKVKNLMSPQQPKKSVPSSEASNNKLVREQTDEFLKKHQYLIHKDEVDFTRTIVPIPVEKENISVDTTELQTAAPKRIEKSPEKEEKTKKNTFSKIKSFVSGSPKKQSADESNRLLRKQTNDFLDDMRKQHDEYKDASDKCKVVWLSEQTLKPTKTQTSKSEIVKPIVLSEQERKEMRLIRQNTDIFLKDHQDYHNKQRNEDNHFIEKIGKPEHMIWLSSKPAKKKENIITKVKNLMSPQQPKKSVPSSEASNNKLVREQTDEFLKKHQYLIHKGEVDFTRTIVPIPVEKENISVDTTELQTAAPKRIEKSSEKEEKTKKNTFSKIKSFVSGSPKKQSADESNRLLRKQTNDFLDDMRKQHDEYKDASDKCKVVWLSEQTLKPTKTQTSKSEIVKPIVLSEQERKEMKLIRQNTDIFLKDHQDYHNKQRNEDNHFIEKIGKPEHMIWLSSKPAKKKENIITKVKNLMSPQQPKKSVPSSEASNNKLVREQTDEFLKKHQYLIHKDEVDFTRTIVPIPVEKENISVDTTELQTAAPKRIEKSPEKEEKTKKNTFSKIKSFVSGSPKKQSADESNRLLRKQTNDFLDDMRKQHDEYKDASDKCKVVWLSEQTLKPTKTQTSKSEIVKPIVLSEQERKKMRLIRQNTDIFLKDHQDYHNKQGNEDNHFIGKIGKPEHMIWLSSKPAKNKENIITKVKNLMSPQQSKKSVPSSEASNSKLVREQTDEFLKKHQYLIHKDEVDFTRTIVRIPIEKENISVDTTELQTAAPKRIEKSPEKEEKTKKHTFSKIKSFVSESPKKQTADESNRVVRKKTFDFLEDMKKHHDIDKYANEEYNVKWLNDKNIKSTKCGKTKLICQNSEIFSEDHGEHPNEQITENTNSPITESPYNVESGSSNHFEATEKELPSQGKNIISKIRNIISPNKSNQSAIFYYDVDCEMRDGVYVKEIYNQNSNIEEPFEPQEGYPTSADFNPERRLKKKVTFSKTDPLETECMVEEQKDPRSTGHNIETASSSEVPIETSKPQPAPRKQVAKRVKAIYIDSAEIFKQNKDRFVIEQTQKFLDDHKIHQNQQWSQIQNSAHDKNMHRFLNQTEMIPRTEGSVTKLLVAYQQKSSPAKALDETYFDVRRNLMLFLDDLQAYHNRERIDHINYISKKNKPPSNELKYSTKETKMKSTLMSKLKSLVGQSQEINQSDKKHEMETANLKKQTSEFLISQKCYNDLEGVALKNFGMTQLEKEKFLKDNVKAEDFAEVSSNQLGSHSNSTLKKDSTFCHPRKLSLDGRPELSTKSQEPQRSSPAKKISKTDYNISKETSDSKITPKRKNAHENSSINHLFTIKENINFLNSQRIYIDSENEIWKQYLKFKPIAGSTKGNISQKHVGKSFSVQYTIQKPNGSARKSSSQLESEKIDHAVILHKTELFLEDQKSFHDNLQKGVAANKFKSEEGIVPEKTFQKHNENIEIVKSNVSNDDSPKISTMKQNENMMKITNDFLKEHQVYHDSERVHSVDNRCEEIQKEKKPKRGVIYKIKSLVTGDSQKRNSPKPTKNITSFKSENEKAYGNPTITEDIIIRDLESSPATYRKHKPNLSLNREKPIPIPIDKSRKISDQIEMKSNKSSDFMASENSFLDKGSEKEILVMHKEDISSRNIYYHQVKGLPEAERKKYAFDKLTTQEFLLNQKEFWDISEFEEKKTNSHKTGENIPRSENKSSSDLTTVSEQQLDSTQGENEDFVKETTSLLPSAPPLEQLDQKDIENSQTVIHRVVKPLSPTKTIFQEIRKREESPDRQVYIMKEGYMITKENKENVKLNKSERMENFERRKIFSTTEEQPQMEKEQGQARKIQEYGRISEERRGKISRVHSDGSPSINTRDYTEGQVYVDRSNDSPSRSVPQGDLEVGRYRTKNCYFIFLVVLVVLIAIHFFREENDEN